MGLTEIDVFGVYVSPYAVLLVAIWAVVFALRVVLTRLGILIHAWHPALLVFSLFAATFSAAVLVATAP